MLWIHFFCDKIQDLYGEKMIKTIKTDLPSHLTLICHPISGATTATSGIKYCTEDASLVLVA